MRSTIVKVVRQPQNSNLWLGVIKELQDRKFKVRRNFKTPSEMVVVLSGLFENPVGFSGKKVLILNRDEWQPRKLDAWGAMYHGIVKHYYDEIIDVTGLIPKNVATVVSEYIDAQERQTD